MKIEDKRTITVIADLDYTLAEYIRKSFPPITVEELENYEEVVLCGYDPAAGNDREWIRLIKKLRKRNGSIVLYTESLTIHKHWKVTRLLDGIRVTLHSGVMDDDMRNFKDMSETLEVPDMILDIEKGVYEKYDLSNISMGAWDVIHKRDWQMIKNEPFILEVRK